VSTSQSTIENHFTFKWQIQNLCDNKPGWVYPNLLRVWGWMEGENGYRITFDTGPIDVPPGGLTPPVLFAIDPEHFKEGKSYPITLNSNWSNGETVVFSEDYATVYYQPIAWSANLLGRFTVGIGNGRPEDFRPA
jgi:hypothetical protein